jgi:hypothetical protein
MWTDIQNVFATPCFEPELFFPQYAAAGVSQASMQSGHTISSSSLMSSSSSMWAEGLKVPLIKCREPVIHTSTAAAATAGPAEDHRAQNTQPKTSHSRVSRSYYLAVNQDTLHLAMAGRRSEENNRLRLLIVSAACQFVEARHGVTLHRETWRVMVRNNDNHDDCVS